MHKNTNKLAVWRTFTDGNKVLVGHLIQGEYGVGFAYDINYADKHPNLSPFKLESHNLLQQAPKTPHQGIHGVFSDSLPDGWGYLLQDRFFAGKGMDRHSITTMDRLAFVGDAGIGALSFEPCIDDVNHQHDSINLYELGKEAQAVYDGQTSEVLEVLVRAGSSGGARPKAQIYTPTHDLSISRTNQHENDIGWIVKFTSENLPLGHDEGLCEFMYLNLAESAGIHPVKHHLFGMNDRCWLGVQRFDLANYQAPSKKGRLHVHSACGLLGADFRAPTLDYETLIRCTNLLCKDTQNGQLMFKRMIFNLFSANQDDHSKNFAFLQDDGGNWSLSPAFDLTFNPLHHGEHSTSFMGYGKNPPKKAIQQLADLAGFDDWTKAKYSIEQIVTALSNFKSHAINLGLNKTVANHINDQLNQIYLKNKSMLV